MWLYIRIWCIRVLELMGYALRSKGFRVGCGEDWGGAPGTSSFKAFLIYVTSSSTGGCSFIASTTVLTLSLPSGGSPMWTLFFRITCLSRRMLSLSLEDNSKSFQELTASNHRTLDIWLAASAPDQSPNAHLFPPGNPILDLSGGKINKGGEAYS